LGFGPSEEEVIVFGGGVVDGGLDGAEGLEVSALGLLLALLVEESVGCYYIPHNFIIYIDGLRLVIDHYLLAICESINSGICKIYWTAASQSTHDRITKNGQK
jgi:hypothetical protein